VLDVADNYLRAAIAEEQRAQEAYAPYWRRGRMRYIVKPESQKSESSMSYASFVVQYLLSSPGSDWQGKQGSGQYQQAVGGQGHAPNGPLGKARVVDARGV